MNEILVAIVFLAMVASPAIFAAFPLKDEEDGQRGLTQAVRIPAASPSRSR